MKKCCIFSGGDFEHTDFIITDEFDIIICADRGYEHALKLGLKPDIIVGDFDSYDGELPDNIDIRHCIPEKDDTDTLLAVKIAISQGTDHITIYGALGGRFDHALANLQTLGYCLNNGCEAVIRDSINAITLQGVGKREYPRRDNWYLSVFAYTNEIGIKELSGVKYILKDVIVNNSFPIGCSNEITDESAVLNLTSGIAVVVYSKM